jgi:hypothetical protein
MDETQCVEELLASCPGFRPHWEEHCAWWSGKAGLMLDLAVFGEYAAQAIERDEPDELAAIAASAEQLLGSESQAVRDAAVVGFLASLMHRCREDAGRLPFERLARQLGPAALAACRKLDEKLGTRTPGLWEPGAAA